MELTENEIYEGLGMEPPEPVAPEGGQDGALETPGAAEPTDPPPAAEPDAPPKGGQTVGEDGGVSNSDTDPVSEPAPTQNVPPAAPPMQPGQSPGQPSAQAQTLPGGSQPAPLQVRGMKDPYTDRIIQTQADYEAYQRAYAADEERIQRERRQEALAKLGLDEETLASLIHGAVASDPAVQEARMAAERAKAQEAAAQQRAAHDWYGKQIQAINAMDPGANIQSVDDLSKRDPAAFRRMLGAVSGGMSLVEAYRTIHFDRLIQAQIQAAEQRVRNQAAGKGHMAPLGGKTGPGDDVTVPAEVMRSFRDLNPGMSEEEIRKQYAATLRETAGTAE